MDRALCSLVLLACVTHLTQGTGHDLSTPTVASVVPRAHNLSCITCHSVDDGDSCVHLNQSDTSHMATKCQEGHVVCVVKRFSYAITLRNGTLPKPDTWSIERKCDLSCESGCIIMGERTKLHVCISCCDSYLCNVGNGHSKTQVTSDVLFAIILLLTCVKQCSFPLT